MSKAKKLPRIDWSGEAWLVRASFLVVAGDKGDAVRRLFDVFEKRSDIRDAQIEHCGMFLPNGTVE